MDEHSHILKNIADISHFRAALIRLAVWYKSNPRHYTISLCAIKLISAKDQELGISLFTDIYRWGDSYIDGLNISEKRKLEAKAELEELKTKILGDDAEE